MNHPVTAQKANIYNRSCSSPHIVPFVLAPKNLYSKPFHLLSLLCLTCQKHPPLSCEGRYLFLNCQLCWNVCLALQILKISRHVFRYFKYCYNHLSVSREEHTVQPHRARYNDTTYRVNWCFYELHSAHHTFWWYKDLYWVYSAGLVIVGHILWGNVCPLTPGVYTSNMLIGFMWTDKSVTLLLTFPINLFIGLHWNGDVILKRWMALTFYNSSQWRWFSSYTASPF